MKANRNSLKPTFPFLPQSISSAPHKQIKRRIDRIQLVINPFHLNKRIDKRLLHTKSHVGDMFRRSLKRIVFIIQCLYNISLVQLPFAIFVQKQEHFHYRIKYRFNQLRTQLSRFLLRNTTTRFSYSQTFNLSIITSGWLLPLSIQTKV